MTNGTPPGVPQQQERQMTGMDRILVERNRQVEKGYTPEHDRGHGSGELILAAEAYIAAARRRFDEAARLWPWDDGHPAPGGCTDVEALARAGALIAAAIDVTEGQYLDDLAAAEKRRTAA